VFCLDSSSSEHKDQDLMRITCDFSECFHARGLYSSGPAPMHPPHHCQIHLPKTLNVTSAYVSSLIPTQLLSHQVWFAWHQQNTAKLFHCCVFAHVIPPTLKIENIPAFEMQLKFHPFLKCLVYTYQRWQLALWKNNCQVWHHGCKACTVHRASD
jgi:hypothetical protein